MQTTELTGFAKVLADWTKVTTRLNAMAYEGVKVDGLGVINLPDAVVAELAELEHITEVFERLMGADDPLPPEKGRVLFCAAPQLGTVIGRSIGNGDAKYVVQLASGVMVTVPADFIGGEESAKRAWEETRHGVRLAYPSPDGKR